MACSLTADTFIARHKKRPLVYFVPHQPPELPDHFLLFKAQTFTMYLLSFDLAFLPLLHLRRPTLLPGATTQCPGDQNLHLSVDHPVWTSHPYCTRPVLSCCCQPPHLAFVAVLPSPLSELPSPVTPTPTQVCWMPQSLFYSQEVEAWVSSGLSCLTKGTGKKDWTELPGDMEGGGRSAWTFSSRQKPSASWLSGRAAPGSAVQWLLHVLLSPAACRWTGRKLTKTLNSLLLLQCLIFLDGTGHIYIHSTPMALCIKGPGWALLWLGWKSSIWGHIWHNSSYDSC